MDDTDGTDETLESLSSEEEQVIINVLDGWWPTLPALADPISAEWNQIHLKSDDIAIEQAGNRLVVQIQTKTLVEDVSSSMRIHITLADGSTLTAGPDLSLRRPLTEISDDGQTSLLRFEFQYWSWRKGPVTAWLSEANDWWRSHSTGNLSARIRHSDAELEVILNNLFFRGLTRSCLLCPSSGVRPYAWGIFNANLYAWLLGDRNLLQWALGHRIGSSVFVGVNSQMETAAIVHHPTRSGEHGQQRPLLSFETSTSHAVNFFEKLSRYLHNDPELISVVQAYVESLDDSQIGEFLKIASALNALASQSHTSIQLSTSDPIAKDFSILVDQALKAAGVDSNNFTEPLTGIDPLRDAPLLFAADPVAGLRLMEICRTAFVAIVARRIGYDGPLMHCDISLHNGNSAIARRLIPDWWLPHIEPQALSRYHVDAKRPRSTIGWGRWPNFEIPHLSDNQIIRGLSLFAAELQNRTSQLVAATVSPYPTQTPGLRAYEFRIFVRALPQTQATIFTVRELSDGIRIEGWSESIITVSDYIQLKKFMSEVANSDRVRTQIERFILIGNSLRTSNQ